MPKLVTTAALLVAFVLVAAFPSLAVAEPMHGHTQVSAGVLPFSGLDAAFILGAGVLLGGLGLALGQARVSRPVFRPARTPARGAVRAEAAVARR